MIVPDRWHHGAQASNLVLPKLDRSLEPARAACYREPGGAFAQPCAACRTDASSSIDWPRKIGVCRTSCSMACADVA